VRTRTSWLAALTALGAALLATNPAPAQDPSKLYVRCVSVLASGGPREKGVAPQFSQLDPWAQKELEKLPDGRFESPGDSQRESPAGVPIAFSQLPTGHDATVTWKPRDGRLELRVVITRPSKPPAPPPREEVLALSLDVADGAHCVVRVVKGIDKETDLLLLFTASTKPL
jgi:hypothetical protein